MYFVRRCFAGHEVDLDLEVFAGLAEGCVCSFWQDHLRLGDAALGVGFVARGPTGHQDRLGAAAGCHACGTLGCVEEREHHGYNLGLHLPHTREDVRVDGVRDGELAKRLRLKPDQLIPAVVYGTADTAVLPARVLHVRQLAQLLAHLLFAPSLVRQSRDALDARAAGDKLALKLQQRLGDLCLDFGADAGQSQEHAVEVASDGNVEV